VSGNTTLPIKNEASEEDKKEEESCNDTLNINGDLTENDKEREKYHLKKQCSEVKATDENHKVTLDVSIQVFLENETLASKAANNIHQGEVTLINKQTRFDQNEAADSGISMLSIPFRDSETHHSLSDTNQDCCRTKSVEDRSVLFKDNMMAKITPCPVHSELNDEDDMDDIVKQMIDINGFNLFNNEK